jgi:hypothetical protein
MNNFLLDLWYDLRAKRLWPVAVVLLAALVAVPVVLSKSAETPEPAEETPVAAQSADKNPEGPAGLAQVKLEERAEGSGSSLSSFDEPRNPFAPPGRARAAAQGDAAVAAAPSTSTSAGPGSAAGSASVSGSDVTGGGSAGVDMSPGSGISIPPSIGKPPSGDVGGDSHETGYAYVVDVTLTAKGRTRKFKGLTRHDVLPNETSPLLISMGVTEAGGNAVFLVDSSLEAAGEGRCKPSAKECARVFIGPGSEHVFTQANGDTYTVLVDEIRKVKVTAGAARASAAKAGNKLAKSNSDSDRR